MNLWAMSATEDCLAYLRFQMDQHGLALGEDEMASARQTITSALLTNFSTGQVWNAIWRSVRDAAALSARPYYNAARASVTIPKKIDKILTQNIGGRGNFPPYDRLASLPMGAVLSLLLNRFGIDDDTPGPEVRAKFASDAALALPVAKNVDADIGRALAQGTFFFRNEVTEQDRMILSCFPSLQTDTVDPEWDDKHDIGRLFFRLQDLYDFDGPAFLRSFLAAKGVADPTEEDFARHAAVARALVDAGKEWVDVSGKAGATTEALLKAGVSPTRVGTVAMAIRFPATPGGVMRMATALPGEGGLYAVRADGVRLYDEFFERSEGFYTGGFSFRFPEDALAPYSSDLDLLTGALEGNLERLADLIATSVRGSVRVDDDPRLNAELLKQVGQRLLEQDD